MKRFEVCHLSEGPAHDHCPTTSVSLCLALFLALSLSRALSVSLSGPARGRPTPCAGPPRASAVSSRPAPPRATPQNVFRASTWKPRPEPGLDCLKCAVFARQREARDLSEVIYVICFRGVCAKLIALLRRHGGCLLPLHHLHLPRQEGTT